MKLSIGAKIFGLAIFLLCLTIGLAGFLLWQVTALNDELETIATRDVPLADSVAQLNENGLRRRLAFERWFGALNAAAPNQKVIEEAKANHETFTKAIAEEMDRARALMGSPQRGDPDAETLGKMRALLDQLALVYPVNTARQRELLELQQAGQHERASAQLDVLNDLHRTIQTQRNDLERTAAGLTEAALREAGERERRVRWLTAGATVSLVALGLLVASLITRRLVGRVQSLVAGLRTVEAGDLTVELPVGGSDEITALTQTFNFFVTELRAKQQLKLTFGKYIDPRILEHVLVRPGLDDTLSGRRPMTVSFTDLVGFTGLGEQLTPSGLVRLLNRYFTVQAEAVQSERGVVDKFIGDAVMAFWGPPFSTAEEHAELACRAALTQLAALDGFRAELPELTGLRRNLPVIDLRIGVSTGEVVVGNIGSDNTRSFTVMGDAVNLGSRLESVNRVYGTRILLSEATAALAGERIVTREIDALTVKGKSEPTRVFELLGLAGEAPRAALRAPFAAGLAAYRAQQWEEAGAAFSECLALDPGDTPSQVFRERVARLRAAPPGPAWDGVWRLESK